MGACKAGLESGATRNDSAEAIVVILVVFAAFCTTETCRWKSSPFKWPLGIDCITASCKASIYYTDSIIHLYLSWVRVVIASEGLTLRFSFKLYQSVASDIRM